MFIKINELYNFFVKSGLQGYANAIEKIALEESDFKEKYPNIYSAWENSKDKPLSAYLAQISRAEAKGIDLSKEEINSFQDIIQILKGEKQRVKSSKSEEILKSLNEEGLSNITEKDIELAFGVGLNDKEIIYLAKDKCNHTWEEKLHYADKFKKERLALFDEDAELMDFKDIDEVRDEYFSRKNTAPFKLKEFYERIKDQALNDSEVIYNSKNYIVAHSKSEKAAQYWEQSCVTVDEKGVVSSGLCSAHPYSSMFNHYDKTIYSFQIITKEYETLKETPRTSFMKKNKGDNLITLSIYRKTGDVAWGGQDTVNRFNQIITPSDLFFALGDEYEEICNKISEYCKKYLYLDVKNLKISEENLGTHLTEESFKKYIDKIPKNIVQEFDYIILRPASFFELKDKIPKDIFEKYEESKVEYLSPDDFFEFKSKISEDIFEKYEEINVEKLYGAAFFEFKSKISEDIFEKYEEANTKVLKSEDFFKFKDKISEDIFEKYEEIKIGKLYSSLFFKFKDKISEDIFEKYEEIKIEKLHSSSFFEFKDKISQGIFEKYEESKVEYLSPMDFFEFKDKISEDIFEKYEEGMAGALHGVDVLRFKDKMSKRYFLQAVDDVWFGEQLTSIAFFKNKNKLPDYVFERHAEEKAMSFPPDEFFKYIKYIPTEYVMAAANEAAQKIDIAKFFDQKDKIPKYIYDDCEIIVCRKANPIEFFRNHYRITDGVFQSLKLIKIRRLALSELFENIEFLQSLLGEDFVIRSIKPRLFFRYKEDIPKEIFDKFAYSKALEMPPKMFFSSKRLIPENIFFKAEEEQLRRAKN